MLIVVALAAILVIVALRLSRLPRTQSPQKLLARARLALRRNELESAESLARGVLHQRPSESSALAILGDALRRQEKFDEAITLYDQIPASDSENFVHARSMAGLLESTDRLWEARPFRLLNLLSSETTPQYI